MSKLKATVKVSQARPPPNANKGLIYIQWFYRIFIVGVLYRIRSVNFGPYVSRTENPNDLRPT